MTQFTKARRSFLLSVLAAAASAAMLVAAGEPSAPDPIVVKPEDNGAALVNPDMGWTLMFYSNIPQNYGSKARACGYGG